MVSRSGKLRKLLLQYFSSSNLIETLPKKGYRLAADVKSPDEQLSTTNASKPVPAKNSRMLQLLIGLMILCIIFIALKLMLGISFHQIFHRAMH